MHPSTLHNGTHTTHTAHIHCCGLASANCVASQNERLNCELANTKFVRFYQFNGRASSVWDVGARSSKTGPLFNYYFSLKRAHTHHAHIAGGLTDGTYCNTATMNMAPAFSVPLSQIVSVNIFLAISFRLYFGPSKSTCAPRSLLMSEMVCSIRFTHVCTRCVRHAARNLFVVWCESIYWMFSRLYRRVCV